jgi:hypothetical protein
MKFSSDSKVYDAELMLHHKWIHLAILRVAIAKKE